MAFNVIKVFGARIQRAHTDQSAQVQIVEITDRNGNVDPRVEIRGFVKNDRYDGPAKGESFVFTDPDEIRNLAAALAEAANEFEQHIGQNFTMETVKIRVPKNPQGAQRRKAAVNRKARATA